jgi:hypothetical protein
MKLGNILKAMACTTVLTAALVAIPSPASAGARVYVRIGPPAPIAEVRGVAPGPRYVWVPGYHNWNGTAYVWAPGRWAVPPRARARWVPARWVHDRHGYYLVRGHWR